MEQIKQKFLPEDSLWRVFYQAKVDSLPTDGIVLIRSSSAIDALQQAEDWLANQALSSLWHWYQVTGVKYEPRH